MARPLELVQPLVEITRNIRGLTKFGTALVIITGLGDGPFL